MFGRKKKKKWKKDAIVNQMEETIQEECETVDDDVSDEGDNAAEGAAEAVSDEGTNASEDVAKFVSDEEENDNAAEDAVKTGLDESSEASVEEVHEDVADLEEGKPDETREVFEPDAQLKSDESMEAGKQTENADAMTEEPAPQENLEEPAPQENQEEPALQENLEESEADPGSEEKMGFFRRLVSGLTKTRKNIVFGIDSIFKGFSHIDDDFYEEIEEILVIGDIGVKSTEEIIENLKTKVKEQHIKEPADCKQLLIDSIKEQMQVEETAYRFEEETSVVLVIGVNGVGKTTTIGKLASKLKSQGKKVIMGAADTFRAAAGEQLTEWAHRAGVEIVGGQEGSDPASVVYDAVQAAKARRADVLLVDTAGRLHNKKNLMEELKKINRILEKEYPDAYRETLVVLDATTGQNALNQAKQFSEAAEITGIVLTKMDGTAKGGIAVAIQSELGIPVKYIGVGEKIEDLQKFDADQFVDALFASTDEM